MTERLIDKDTWTNFANGFNDAFIARHKRRKRPKSKDAMEEADKIEAFALESDEKEKEDEEVENENVFAVHDQR